MEHEYTRTKKTSSFSLYFKVEGRRVSGPSPCPSRGTSLQSQEILNRPVFFARYSEQSLNITENTEHWLKNAENSQHWLNRFWIFWTLLKILNSLNITEQIRNILNITEDFEQIRNILNITEQIRNILNITENSEYCYQSWNFSKFFCWLCPFLFHNTLACVVFLLYYQ